MSERYIARFGLIRNGFGVFDRELKTWESERYDTWAQAQAVAGKLNYPPPEPQEPPPAAPCCDCARLRATLAEIARTAGEEPVIRLANEALDLEGGEHAV